MNADPEKTIVSSRVLGFAREVVFRAWSDPALLKRWWGPSGFTNTFHTFDFRVGGRWRFTMHGPDKGNYENECEFLQIDPPSLILWKRHSKPLFNAEATFREIPGNKTELVFRMIFGSEKECTKMKKYVIGKNEENFDRLESVLQSLTQA